MPIRICASHAEAPVATIPLCENRSSLQKGYDVAFIPSRIHSVAYTENTLIYEFALGNSEFDVDANYELEEITRVPVFFSSIKPTVPHAYTAF